MSNDYAIFVAPTGKDGAGGTKAGPVKTIAKAVELAGSTKMIIACNGSFDEHVKLTAGVKLYGGFACPGSVTPWTYESGKKASVAPSTKGYALNIATDAASALIEDFEFDALDGTDSGESSVAAMVSSSNQVALNRVKLVAGKGVDGAKGTLTPFAFPDQTTLNGKPAMANVGGLPNPYATCPGGGITKGGGGGTGGPNPTGGDSGAPALGGGAAGTVNAVCAGPGGGGNGADALAQAAAPGAIKLGTITPTGWTGAPGSDGTPGTPGQGGGGGTGAATGGGGGGGGAGSCGGAPGTGGKAGGSSIALLVLNSTIALSASELVAGDAGKGGNGVAGQDGQPTAGSAGAFAGDGCGGGKGGKGGKGGAGGGAAGGVSLGIAYQGMAPSTDTATTFTTGVPGAKGVGGVPGTNDGIDGIKQDVLLIP